MDDLHESQRVFWDKEHKNPNMVLNMDYKNPSGGVVRFFEWLQSQGNLGPHLRGIEMGCGKGRNAIGLAEKGIAMTGFDFSGVAIEEAKKRATEAGLSDDQMTFFHHDATRVWPFKPETFDIGIDCFASTDIENLEGRTFALSEFKRVLKPNGYLFVYAISNESSFHKGMLEQHAASEKNTYTHPGSKIDKVYDEEELREFYKDWKIVEFQKMDKQTKGVFYGKEHDCVNFWMIFQLI